MKRQALVDDFLVAESKGVSEGVSFSGPMSAHVDDVPEVLEGLKLRGQMWDKTGASGKQLLHKDLIEYHGTYKGRPIVEVKMPDGSSEMFYKSTNWAKKGTGGKWQVYGGHSSTHNNKNWFIKDEGFKEFYGSKTFKEMAENLDDALSSKYGTSKKELDKLLNFKNVQSKADTYTPSEISRLERDLRNDPNIVKKDVGFVDDTRYSPEEKEAIAKFLQPNPSHRIVSPGKKVYGGEIDSYADGGEYDLPMAYEGQEYKHYDPNRGHWSPEDRYGARLSRGEVSPEEQAEYEDYMRRNRNLGSWDPNDVYDIRNQQGYNNNRDQYYKGWNAQGSPRSGGYYNQRWGMQPAANMLGAFSRNSRNSFKGIGDFSDKTFEEFRSAIGKTHEIVSEDPLWKQKRFGRRKGQDKVNIFGNKKQIGTRYNTRLIQRPGDTQDPNKPQDPSNAPEQQMERIPMFDGYLDVPVNNPNVATNSSQEQMVIATTPRGKEQMTASEAEAKEYPHTNVEEVSNVQEQQQQQQQPESRQRRYLGRRGDERRARNAENPMRQGANQAPSSDTRRKIPIGDGFVWADENNQSQLQPGEEYPSGQYVDPAIRQPPSKPGASTMNPKRTNPNSEEALQKALLETNTTMQDYLNNPALADAVDDYINQEASPEGGYSPYDYPNWEPNLEKKYYGGQIYGSPFKWDPKRLKFNSGGEFSDQGGWDFNMDQFTREGLIPFGHQFKGFLDQMNEYRDANSPEAAKQRALENLTRHEKDMDEGYHAYNLRKDIPYKRGANVLPGTGDIGSFNQGQFYNYTGPMNDNWAKYGGLIKGATGMEKGSEHTMTNKQRRLLEKAGYSLTQLH